MPYFAILDRQTKSYMHIGFNATSIEDIIESYISYKSIDTDLEWLEKEIALQTIQNVLEEDEFILLSSSKPFVKH